MLLSSKRLGNKTLTSKLLWSELLGYKLLWNRLWSYELLRGLSLLSSQNLLLLQLLDLLSCQLRGELRLRGSEPVESLWDLLGNELRLRARLHGLRHGKGGGTSWEE